MRQISWRTIHKSTISEGKMTVLDRINFFLMYTLLAYLLFNFFAGLYSITSQTPGQIEYVIENIAISLLSITSGLISMALSRFDCNFKVAIKHFFGFKKPEFIVCFKEMRIASKILLSCGYFLLTLGGLMLILSILFAPLISIN
tara:strand:+ start:352 stop:783 length:432 start_codon:yes stop_codon:yes gene_type:complete